MAEFYKEPNPTNDPNYLGMSKEPDRVQADKSLGQLFEGVAGLFDTTIKAGNKLIVDSIKDDAHKLIDPIQAEHGSYMNPTDVIEIAGTGAKGRVRALQMKGAGLGDGTPSYDTDGQALGYGPEDAARDARINSIFPVNDKKPLPPQASREISQLQRLQQAYYAGNLSDSYYNAQLVSVSKQLRAQYPGYRDEVDAAVSQITGIQPANALRASLMRDIQANLSAQLANASSDDKWRDQNARFAVAAGYDPYKTPIEVLKPAVAQYRGETEIMNAQALRANVNSPEAERILSETLGRMSTGSLVAIGNRTQGQMPLADFEAKARELSLKGGGDPKEVQQLATQMEMTMNSLRIQMRQRAYAPIEGDKEGRTLVGKVSGGDQKIDQMIEAQLRPWKEAITLVKSGNMSALQTTTDMLKYQGNRDLQNLFDAFPGARIATAINNAFPNNPLMSNQFLQQSSILPDFAKGIKTGLGNAILNGGAIGPDGKKLDAPTPTEAVKHYGKNLSEKEVSAAYKETIKQYDLVIAEDNKNTDNAAHVAKKFFTDMKFYDNLSDDGRMKLFLKMAAPSKTAFIKDLANKDPEVWQTYQEWAKYAASDIWRRGSDNLQALLTDKRYSIHFNMKSMQFEDQTQYDPRDGQFSTAAKAAVTRPLNAVNNAITWLRPIVGDDPASILPALGVNPLALKEDFLAEKLVRATGQALLKAGKGLSQALQEFPTDMGMDSESSKRKDLKEGNPR